MKYKREYKTISAKTRNLLSGTEGFDVDFKRTSKDLKSKDIIAFANSPDGGTILAGVDESENKSGIQRGRIIGTDVGDSAIVSIQNKAADCIPSIKLDIYIENTNKLPFLRIDIPSSPYKPHCTASGEYTIRMQHRTKGIHPAGVLSIYLSKETDTFISNFKNAIEDTELKIDELKVRTQETTEEISDKLLAVYSEVLSQFESVYDHLENSVYSVEETKDTTDELWRMVKDIHEGMSNVQLRDYILDLQNSIDTLIYHNNLTDPNFETKKNDVLYMYMRSESKTDKASLQNRIKARYPFLRPEVIQEMINGAENYFNSLIDRTSPTKRRNKK